MEAQTLTFFLERETKNTIRYSEQTDSNPPAVGTIYVQKWAMGDNPPKTLTVTVSSVRHSGILLTERSQKALDVSRAPVPTPHG